MRHHLQRVRRALEKAPPDWPEALDAWLDVQVDSVGTALEGVSQTIGESLNLRDLEASRSSVSVLLSNLGDTPSRGSGESE